MNFHDSVNVKVCERVISMAAVLRRVPCAAANQNESVEREDESGSLCATNYPCSLCYGLGETVETLEADDLDPIVSYFTFCEAEESYENFPK